MTQQPRIDGIGDGPDLLDLIGGRLAIVGRADAPNADAVILRGVMAPGSGVPLHSHDDYECFHVLSGRIEVFIESVGWTGVGAGRSAVIAHGERHAVRNPADEPAELLMVVNNRLARFFHEAGTPGVPGEDPAPPTPDRIAHVLGVAGRYGYWMATPEEDAAITGGAA